jgi:hypothetical protein
MLKKLTQRRFAMFLFSALVLVISAAKANASVLFSNGTPSYSSLGYYITGNLVNGTAVSVAFTVDTSVSLTDAQLVVFTPEGDPTPNTVSWLVGAGLPFSSNIASGTAAGATLTVSPPTLWSSWNLSDTTISLPNINIPAGTYYLTLYGAGPSAGTGWVESATLPPGIENCNEGNPINYASNGYPLYFAIEGNAVPEPGTLVLLAPALLALVAIHLRRRRAKA